MPDSSAIDTAVIGRLLADAALAALLPDGWYMDVAADSLERYGLLSIIEARDVPNFGGRAYEDVLYQVKAVMLSSAGGDIEAAAARIDAVLEDATLAIPGYGLMTLHREERIRAAEADAENPALFWFHRGGRYRLQASL